MIEMFDQDTWPLSCVDFSLPLAPPPRVLRFSPIVVGNNENSAEYYFASRESAPDYTDHWVRFYATNQFQPEAWNEMPLAERWAEIRSEHMAGEAWSVPWVVLSQREFREELEHGLRDAGEHYRTCESTGVELVLEVPRVTRAERSKWPKLIDELTSDYSRGFHAQCGDYTRWVFAESGRYVIWNELCL